MDWETTQNLMIEGDNLEVLKLLQKSYAGKVKLIYIDPPYKTGKDSVYPDNSIDNIRNYLELTGQVEDSAKISTNAESSGRFHTQWLNMIYPRLKLARDLLHEEGVLFVTIDSTELDNLTSILKEIMGQENYTTTFVWEKRRSRENRKPFSVNHDYVVSIARNKEVFNSVRGMLPLTEEARNRYSNPDKDPRGDWQSVAVTAQAGHGTAAQFYTIKTPSGREVNPPSGNCWRFTLDRFNSLVEDNRIWFGPSGSNVPRQKIVLAEQNEGLTPHTLWKAEEVGTTDSSKRDLMTAFDGDPIFDTPKPVALIQRMLEIGVARDATILDFFGGSGATGEAVVRQNLADNSNRRYIIVQLPEPLDFNDKDQRIAANFCNSHKLPCSIAELTKERLRRAAKKIKEENPLFAGDLGFRVFKLDSSNIRAWEPNPDDLDQTLLDAVTHLKDGRTETDVLYELLLKLGLDLCTSIETRTIAGKAVHAVGAGVLIACLAERIESEDVEALGQGIVALHRELDPAGDTTCVFRDSAFADDIAKTNIAAILEQNGIANVRSL